MQTDWLKEKLIASHELSSLWLKAYRRALFEDDHHDYAAFRGVHCGEDKAQLLYPVTRAGSIYISQTAFTNTTTAKTALCMDLRSVRSKE